MTHAEVIKRAAHWLRGKRYAIVLEDVRCNAVGEQPDVMGWKNHGASALIECKASIEDYRRDAVKPWRRNDDEGMGRLRWYAVPAKLAPVIGEAEVHRGPFGNGRWGVLGIEPRRVTVWLSAQPFMRWNETEETKLLIAATRRAIESWGRRMFGADAPAILEAGDPHPTTARFIRELQAENAKLRARLAELDTSASR